jgi:hypothetical protein
MHRLLTPVQWHGNVVFNFHPRPVRDLLAFGVGYREAGRILANRIAAANGYADYDGYPILYLYRHSLELHLKAIVYHGAALLGLIAEERVNTDRLFERHELARLLPPIRAIFEQMRWTFDNSGFASYDDFAEFIRDLDIIDPGSYAFRYPIGRRGQALLPPHFVINVVEFSDHMETLLRLLEGAATAIDENWQAEAEARHELAQLADEWRIE